VAGAVDLALEQQQAQLAAQRSRELVELRVTQLGSGLLTIARGGLAVRGALRAIGRRLLAIVAGLISIGDALVGLRLRLLAIGHREVAVGHRALAVGSRALAAAPIGCRLREVSTRGAVIANCCRALAAVGEVVAR